MQDCVLDAARLLVNRRPVLCTLVQHDVVIVGTGVTREIPRRLHKGIESVRFASRVLATLRTGSINEFRHVLEGRTRPRDFDIFSPSKRHHPCA